MTYHKLIPCAVILLLSACGGGGGGGVPGVDTGSSSGGSSGSSGDSYTGYGISGTYYDTNSYIAGLTAHITQSGSSLSGDITVNSDNCLGDTGGTIAGTIGSLSTYTSSIRQADASITITMNNGVKVLLDGGKFYETHMISGQYTWSFGGATWRYSGGSCDGQSAMGSIALNRYGDRVNL